jgi:hypothetical protein
MSSRQAIDVTIAICADLAAPGGLVAQSPAAKSKLAVALSVKKINFGKVPAGTRSSPQIVTLTNKSKVEMSAPAVVVSGAGFSLDSNGCTCAILPAASCLVGVSFTPPKIGKFKNGLLKFSDAAAKSPQKVKLIGVGASRPSPTATPMQTPTTTASTTPTASPSATATSTGGSTSTSTVTATASTATSTATSTVIATSTFSATATTTASHTATSTASSTQTAKGSPTPTRTQTATTTPTVKATASGTGSQSITPTATLTSTAGASATATPTLTPTASPTATSTASAALTVTPTPTATSTAVFNIAFVSSTTSNGDLGGQAGADAECAILAAAANLPNATYKAWLSTSTTNAAAKLGTARGFVRPDGQPFADQVSDIAAGNILNPLILDESGNNLAHQIVWTGTADAGIASAFACGDWLIGTGVSFGELGKSTGGAGAWSDDAGETSCNAFAHLYCFGTSQVNALTVTPTPGRIAFVSKGSFATSQAVSGADSLCQNEASAAGLANPTTFLALLSTSTAPAASRFDVSAMSAPYVRPDGIEIADAPTIAAGSTLDSGIWQHADGSYVTEFAAATWTGSAAPNVVGTLPATCQDWMTTNGADTGSEGVSNVTDTWWNSSMSTSCAEPLSVYCLAQ